MLLLLHVRLLRRVDAQASCGDCGRCGVLGALWRTH